MESTNYNTQDFTNCKVIGSYKGYTLKLYFFANRNEKVIYEATNGINTKRSNYLPNVKRAIARSQQGV